MGTTLHNRIKYYNKEKNIIVRDGHRNNNDFYYSNVRHDERFDFNQNNNVESGLKNYDILYDDIDIPNYYIRDDVRSPGEEPYHCSPSGRIQSLKVRSAGHRNSNMQMKSRGTQVSLHQVVKDTNCNAKTDYLWNRDTQESMPLNYTTASSNDLSREGFGRINCLEYNNVNNVDNAIGNNNNNDCRNHCYNNIVQYPHQLQPDYNSNHDNAFRATIQGGKYSNNMNENHAFWTSTKSSKPSCFPRNKSHRLSSSYEEYSQLLSKSFCKSPSPTSSSSSCSSSPSPLSSPQLSPLLHKPKKTSSSCSYSSTYQQYYQRRLLRTRKFRLNLFMYANLYRKHRKAETSYEIYHNPLEDPDATYTSFSNPNYFLNRPNSLPTSNNNKTNRSSSDSVHSSNNNSEDTASLEKLSIASDASGHYSDYSSCEPTPTTPDRSLILHKLNSADEYDDFDDVDDDGKSDENKSLIESRSSDDFGEEASRSSGHHDGKGNEPHVFYGIGGLPWSKSKGILGYLEMLEKQAMARTATDEVNGERPDDDADDNDKEDDEDEEDDKIQPKANGDGENPNEQQENEKFEHTTEINSPDSNDSGIQPGDKILSPDCPSDIETTKSNNEQQDHKSPTKATPEKLPEGWQKHEDEDGPYFWHVKSGTIQREPPPPAPPDGPSLCSPRSISLASDSASTSSNSMPSTPTSVGSITERHLAEFEGQALHYAAKSLQAMSQPEKKSSSGGDMSGEKGVRFTVRSLGWVRIAEEDLNPERSSRAVNKCIVDLSLGRNDLSDSVGRWGDGRELFMDLDQHSLRLVNPTDGVIFNSQPIHSIRVWGVGRDNGRDFAYVARDRKTRMHMCHVFHCDVPARQIANTLRDICKKIMLERNLHQNAVARLARPTDLPNLDKVGHHTNGEKLSFQNLYNNARFPTPMEEPRKVIRSHYLGVTEVARPTGRDLLNEAIQSLYYRIPPEKWMFVNVAIAPSTITITEHGYSEAILEECRVRFLSFMGIAVDNVKLCAFIMHTAQNKFMCHVFHCEPSAGPLCKTIEAACKLRYQKCMDAHPQTNRAGQAKSVGEFISSGVKAGVQGLKDVKSSAVNGVRNLFKGKNAGNS